jgi:hypothetical protein
MAARRGRRRPAMTMLLEPVMLTEARTVESEGIELALAAQTIERLAKDPFFVGHAFAVCKDRFDIDERTLALFLGCPIAGLTTMALYSRPDTTLPHYCHALKRVAAAGHADPAMLHTLLELAEPLERAGA